MKHLSMESNEPLKAALQSLAGALDKLEDVVEDHIDDRRRLQSLDGEISDMMMDRSRLAQSLDKVEARAGRLEDVNKEVSRRLVNAMDSIRSVLEAHSKKSNRTG